MNEVVIDYNPSRRGDKLCVTARLPNGEKYPDKINPASARDRAKFSKALCERWHNIVPAEVEAQLALIPDKLRKSTAAVIDITGHEADEEPGNEIEIPYIATEQGLVQLNRNGDSTEQIPLANFSARITADILRDDGVETSHDFEIEVKIGPKTRRINVPVAKFLPMNWPTEQLGAEAILYPGYTKKDHARAAIQLLSSPTQRRVYTHTGWREVDGRWLFLHGGGGIGAEGNSGEVEVALHGTTDHYRLPDPPAGEQVREAIAATLRILNLADDSLTVPLLAAVFRAPLGPCDSSLHLVGPSGAGKTELAALCQQHFGPEMDARHLPGSWSSTGNSLEGLAFILKDALLVVDDFAPQGSTADVQRLHRDAARLIRAQGNRSGRGRMRADASLRDPKPPRGLILSTGEDVPMGQSIRARLLVLEVEQETLNWDILTECQKDARDGLYAQTMAAYLKWLAPNYDGLRRRLPTAIAKWRQTATEGNQHRRVPEILANLMIGLESFTVFATDFGALTERDAKEFLRRAWAALLKAATPQSDLQAASDPVSRYINLLTSALASGVAHVADIRGNEPPSCECWGWRFQAYKPDDQPANRPLGERIGWIDGEDLYLNPTAAFKVARREADASGEGLNVTPRTLNKRLSEQRKLRSRGEDRGRIVVRRVLQGSRQDVLHFAASTLMPPGPARNYENWEPSKGPSGPSNLPDYRRPSQDLGGPGSEGTIGTVSPEHFRSDPEQHPVRIPRQPAEDRHRYEV